MIAVKRLKELWNDDADVWRIGWTNEGKKPISRKVREVYTSKSTIIHDTKDWFETKEDAEWGLEFGNITRTETLCLPAWEEVERDSKDRLGEFPICECSSINMYLMLRGQLGIDQIIVATMKRMYYFKLTKEDYIKACRLAKKTFLGECDDKN